MLTQMHSKKKDGLMIMAGCASFLIPIPTQEPSLQIYSNWHHQTIKHDSNLQNWKCAPQWNMKSRGKEVMTRMLQGLLQPYISQVKLKTELWIASFSVLHSFSEWVCGFQWFSICPRVGTKIQKAKPVREEGRGHLHSPFHQNHH